MKYAFPAVYLTMSELHHGIASVGFAMAVLVVHGSKSLTTAFTCGASGRPAIMDLIILIYVPDAECNVTITVGNQLLLVPCSQATQVHSFPSHYL